MTRRAVEGSPQTYARVGGTLYLFIIVAALFGELFVRGRLIVRGDAAATASNILGSETLFRVGLAGEMLTCLCDVALAMILYVLLKPVSRNVALLAAFHRVTFVAVYATSKLFLVAAVVVLGGADYLKVFDPPQLQALAYLSLRLHGQGYGLSLIFFGGSLCAARVPDLSFRLLAQDHRSPAGHRRSGLPGEQLCGDPRSTRRRESVPLDHAARRCRGIGARPVARREGRRCAEVGRKEHRAAQRHLTNTAPDAVRPPAS